MPASQAEHRGGTEEWLTCMEECACLMKQNGAVVIEFRSPDDPDEYLEYTYTLASGRAGHGRRPAISGYHKAWGNGDVTLALREMYSGRDARTRARASGRMRKKEALRMERGDFEVSEDGILVRYRGKDEEVVIPEGVRVIGDAAFVDKHGLDRFITEDEEYDAPPMKSLIIPEGVEKIGFYAFAYCLNLEKAEIAESVTSIGERAFEGCESLKEIHLPSGLERIEENTFFLCNTLKKVNIPESVREIGDGAFRGCCDLKRVVLPENLVRIGEKAFDECDLKKVRIPKNVTEIGKDAFPEETVIC